jgi:hypothetical protein
MFLVLSLGEILKKTRGQKCFQKSKMDKKNVQFSKMEILYEKRVKNSPF